MVTSAPRSNNVRAQGGGGPPAQRRGTLPGGAADPADPAHARFPSPTTPARRPPQTIPASRAGRSGGTGTFRLAVRPALESRTAPPWAVATRGMLGSPGGRAQASPRSHERPGLTHGPVSRTARSHARPWAYTRLGPIHTSSRCPPTSSGSASAGCLSIRSTARWPQRGGDLPAVSVRRRCGTRGGGSAAPPEKQPGPRHAPRAWWDAGVSVETRGLLFPPAQQGEPGDAEAGQDHGARLGHGGWTGRSNGSCERFPLQRFPLQEEIFCSSQPQVS
jgi:hypothetical protein